MKLFKRNQSIKKPEDNYNKILNESEIQPYPYTPTLDAEDIDFGDKDSLFKDEEIEGRYVNNTQQSFTVIPGKNKDDSQSTIKEQKSHFNEIQKREVNKNTSFVVRDSQLYGDDISSIHGDIGGYDDLESVTDNSSTINNNNYSSKNTTQYSRTTREEMSETTSNYQNSSENNYTNLQTQSIYATPIFSGFLYKLGRNKRWQWRMFCFDGMSLACLSSKCKPKYVIPLEKIESIKLLHRNAPEYKPNTFVITVEKNDCKGKMDEGFFPYSEGSVSNDSLRPKRTFSMGYYSYLLRAKTSVDLERWMFVLLTMYSVMKREKMMNMQSFNISASPPQPLFSFVNSNSQINNSFQSRNENSYSSRGRINNYDGYDSYNNINNSVNINNTQDSLNQPTSDSLRQIKIPSLSFAPPLSTMITSQYKDRVDSLNTHGSSTPTTSYGGNINNLSKGSAMKSNNSYNNNSNNSDTKVEIISAQRYRDPNYNPVNYTSDLSNLRIESRRNKGPKSNKQTFNNPYVLSKESNSSSGGSSNGIAIRAVNSPNTNSIVSPKSLAYMNNNNSPPNTRKASLNSLKNNRTSPQTSPKSSRGGNRNGRESVIVSSIMQDFIFDDFNKNEEIDESLKEYAVQSLRLFSLAEQKAAVENVQQAWNLGREEDEKMLDILVQELRKTPIKIEKNRESIVSQMAEIEIMDDDDDNMENPNSNDNTFISFAVNVDPEEEEDLEEGNSKIYRNRSTGHINKRNDSKNGPKPDNSPRGKRKSMANRNSTYVQKAWRNSIASLLNLDNEMNVSLGLTNFCPTLPRKSGSLSRTSSLPMEKFSKANNNAAFNKSLGRGEDNAITPRMVNNTRLAGFNTISRNNQSKAIYLGDIAEESESDDSDSDDDDLNRPVRKDSMNTNHEVARKNRMSYIPKSRPFSYYLGKKSNQ